MPDVVEKVRSATLLVSSPFYCRKCNRLHTNTATGFFIHPSGLVVTNHHVLDGALGETVVVMDHKGRVYVVEEVCAANKTFDLAIIRVGLEKGERVNALEIGTPPPQGAAIGVMSHPDGNLFTFTEGRVSRYFRRGHRGPVAMALTADFARGSSGGPVFDSSGAVVGVVESTRTIYYDRHGGVPSNVQMVIKAAIPTPYLDYLVIHPSDQHSGNDGNTHHPTITAEGGAEPAGEPTDGCCGGPQCGHHGQPERKRPWWWTRRKARGRR